MYEGADDANERNGVGGQVSESSRQGSLVERLPKYGIQVMPTAAPRRTVLKRHQNPARPASVPKEASGRASSTAAMRQKCLKELTNRSHCGLSGVLSSQTNTDASCEAQGAGWALYQMEHAWMLSAVEGSYDTLLEFLSEDPYLLTRRDFISGYTVLHWLAKKGQDETLLKLLNYARTLDLNVNVNVRGSGGLTPLHLACMHGQYMVIKLFVGAFGANVDIMDYNGKKAWQYLKRDAPVAIKELLGEWDNDYSYARNVNTNNSAEISEPETLGEVNCNESTPFERTRSRSSWRFSSVRKLLQSFTSPGNNQV